MWPWCQVRAANYWIHIVSVKFSINQMTRWFVLSTLYTTCKWRYYFILPSIYHILCLRIIGNTSKYHGFGPNRQDHKMHLSCSVVQQSPSCPPLAKTQGNATNDIALCKSICGSLHPVLFVFKIRFYSSNTFVTFIRAVVITHYNHMSTSLHSYSDSSAPYHHFYFSSSS